MNNHKIEFIETPFSISWNIYSQDIIGKVCKRSASIIDNAYVGK
ncbi:hypothetical protein RINTHH_17220 [Richelia intracellularis HH01]|uniref:Uncharacterized protein n=1 Tax=Richelia intracellularis HH01 TaxID=1165094 RepID=M1WZT4_9NOST|nr:hypothetical protein RINTHH_17220 [Richelia intracellularis HH01]